MSRGKNPIWQYFQKLSNNQSKAECTECNKILSLGSDKPRHQTVSGLKSHLSTCHKDIYTIYLKRVAEDDGEQVNKKMKAESGASGSKPVTTWTQPTLQNLSLYYAYIVTMTLHTVTFGFGFRPKVAIYFR